MSIRCKKLEAVKMLLDLGLDANSANRDGRTPLMGAASKDGEVVQMPSSITARSLTRGTTAAGIRIPASRKTPGTPGRRSTTPMVSYGSECSQR